MQGRAVPGGALSTSVVVFVSTSRGMMENWHFPGLPFALRRSGSHDYGGLVVQVCHWNVGREHIKMEMRSPANKDASRQNPPAFPHIIQHSRQPNSIADAVACHSSFIQSTLHPPNFNANTTTAWSSSHATASSRKARSTSCQAAIPPPVAPGSAPSACDTLHCS